MVLSAHGSSTPSADSDRLPNRSRYDLLLKIASGGTATVYIGRANDAASTSDLVAIKRAHAHLVRDREFRRLLLAEARLASCVRHPNVVAVHDIEEFDDELLLVMDYVEGASLSELMAGVSLPPAVAVRVALDACAGLDAAHELRDEKGNLLRLVHRDISPQNILVGIDGVARIADFGIAKSCVSANATGLDVRKGKPGYMAPEYIAHGEVGRRGDVFGMGVVVWEALAGRRLFEGTSEADTLGLVSTADAPALSSVTHDLASLDAPLRRALARSAADRYPTIAEFAADLTAAAQTAQLEASRADVAAFVRTAVSEALARRRTHLRARLEPTAAGQPTTAEVIVSPAGPCEAPATPASTARIRVIGRYALHGEIAHGGMATVHLGRLLGSVGFAKTVAIKRLHPHFAKDPEFVSMFLDEARLAARIRHPNVVSTLDVVAKEGELFLVMEYMPGESLGMLLRRAEKQGTRVPPEIVASIMAGVLHGLHAAHEATSERGEPLSIVHRDVSPQNILVGSDGVSRVLDFGVAKAAGRIHTTRDGQVKGKLAYMSPEQVTGTVTRATDIWAASVVLWEALVGQRLFQGTHDGETLKRVLDYPIPAPSTLVPGLPASLDALTLRGLRRPPEDRFASAREMAKELERALTQAPASVVGEFVERVAGSALAERAERVVRLESSVSAKPNTDSAAQLVATRAVDVPDPPSSAALEAPGEGYAATAIMNPLADLPSESDVAAEPRGRTRRLAAIAAGSCALLIAVVAGLVIRTRPSVSSAHAPSSSTMVEARPASSAELPTAAPLPVAALSGSSTEATPRPAVSPKPAPPAATTPRTSAKAPRKPKSNCSPPYTLDTAGDKHFKPECY